MELDQQFGKSKSPSCLFLFSPGSNKNWCGLPGMVEWPTDVIWDYRDNERLYQRNLLYEKSQFHRVVWVGRGFEDHLVQRPSPRARAPSTRPGGSRISANSKGTLSGSTERCEFNGISEIEAECCGMLVLHSPAPYAHPDIRVTAINDDFNVGFKPQRRVYTHLPSKWPYKKPCSFPLWFSVVNLYIILGVMTCVSFHTGKLKW